MSFMSSDRLTPPGIPWSQALRTLANRFGGAPAFNDGAGVLGYDELSARAHALAHLLHERGIGHGTEVATLLPNSLAAAWVSYGLKLAGVAETPMNFGYTGQEIAWSARVARFHLVITNCQRESDVQEQNLDTLRVEDIAPTDHGKSFDSVPAHVLGRILFTSGTTGFPKAAVYTHGRRWVGEQLLKATLPFVPKRGERILLMTPFTHGASLLAFAWCDYGGEVLLLNGVQAEPIRTWLSSGSVSAIFAPPTMLAKLAMVLGRRRYEGVRCVFTGTQPLTATHYEAASAMFGPAVRVTFGKTECINPITVLDGHGSAELYSRPFLELGTCVGWPAPGVEIHIDRQAGEQYDSSADEGEVWLRAQQMSNGMLSVEGFTPHEPQGWHRTGDQGYIDAKGRLWLTGRLADVIKTGGYRVNPDEVEWVLAEGNSAGRIVVTSIPSDYWGEVIVAVAENPDPDWEEVARARAKKLSRHKQPRIYTMVQDLPRNAQGKVNRRKLRELVLTTGTYKDGPYPQLVLAHERIPDQ
jgi:malonyl-CoA/methylmalonyl-CoA synthetase